MKIPVIIIALSIAFSACQKGDTGYPGPQGPPGPQGNANVKSWFYDVHSSDWGIYGMPGNSDHSKYVILGIPELNASFVDDGLVMVYLAESGGYYTPLPITAPNGTTDVLIYNYINIGQVEIDIQLSNLMTPNTINANYTFKVVAVSGAFRIANSDLNWKDYNAVAERLNLE